MFHNDLTDSVDKYGKFSRTFFLPRVMLVEIIDVFLCLTIDTVDEV